MAVSPRGPFPAQIDYLRRKTELPTARWDDLLRDGHDRAFTVAGMASADMLADVHRSVTAAVARGATIDEWQAEFEHVAASWIGEGSDAQRAWRARVILDTNVRTSYAAGKWQEFQAGAKDRPYLMWHHSDSVMDPRPEHVAWDGRVVHISDPWLRTHYPPNGFGCQCWMTAHSEAEVKANGWTVVSPPPDEGGVDPGWDYAPGRTLIDDATIEAKRRSLPARIADGFMGYVRNIWRSVAGIFGRDRGG